MKDENLTVVMVHGWSVRSTETYGELPQRLKAEGRRDSSLGINVRDLWLSKYISFHNEVRLEDIARAMEAAFRRELGAELAGGRLAVITHSTGGPAVREWLQRYYISANKPAPVSHLIMLAPANFGSALAQLGRTRLARLKTWFEGVEPGLGVLDWLELGSEESLQLNAEWRDSFARLGKQGVYSFVLTGTTVDHKAYDHVNSYTGEMGGDGVVRVAAANLNHRYFCLQQRVDSANATSGVLELVEEQQLSGMPFRIVAGRAHSGDRIGILRSVRNNRQDHPTVAAILDCLLVRDLAAYRQAAKTFADENERVLASQRVTTHSIGPIDRTIIHDPCAQLIVRVRDDAGHALNDFELTFVAGRNDPNLLPPGFHLDRQRNQRHSANLTFFFNAATMLGDSEVRQGRQVLRQALPGADGLGLHVKPYPLSGFVHYLPALLPASNDWLHKLVAPHQTTVVDIRLHRVVHEGVFRLTRRHETSDFTKATPGPVLESDPE